MRRVWPTSARRMSASRTSPWSSARWSSPWPRSSRPAFSSTSSAATCAFPTTPGTPFQPTRRMIWKEQTLSKIFLSSDLWFPYFRNRPTRSICFFLWNIRTKVIFEIVGLLRLERRKLQYRDAYGGVFRRHRRWMWLFESHRGHQILRSSESVFSTYDRWTDTFLTMMRNTMPWINQ